MGQTSSKLPVKPKTLQEIESINQQFSFFESPEENNENLEFQNKKRLTEALKRLQKKNLLAGKTLSNDFEILETIDNSQEDSNCTLYIVKDKSFGIPSNGQKKVIRRQTINLSKKLTFFKELEFLVACTCNPNACKNILPMEEIFFEFSDGTISLNVVMPHIKQDFMSWLKNNTSPSRNIYKFGRSANEVRNTFIGIFQGVCQMHANRIMNAGSLHFANLLIDENDGNECKICGIGTDQEFEKVFSSKASFSTLRQQFVAPETITYKTERSIIDALENPKQLSLEKTDFFTEKCDIYSCGVMLYNIFVSDAPFIPSADDKLKFNEKTIEDRIDSVFDMGNLVIPDEMLTDLTKLIKSSLSNNPNERFTAQHLLKTNLFLNSKFRFAENLQDMLIRALKYDEGDGLPHNYFKARQILEKIAFRGLTWVPRPRIHPPSPSSLMEIDSPRLMDDCNIPNIQNGTEIDSPTTKNHSKDGYWIRGFAAARFCLGFYDLLGSAGKCNYATGDLVCRNTARGARLFFENMNDKYGYFMCGLLHDLGFGGLGIDKGKAMELYKKAADQGHAGSMSALALLFEESDKAAGSNRNSGKAEHYLLTAAKKGESAAIYTIGTLYEFGHGVGKSHSEAFKYFKMAADMGEVGGITKMAQFLHSGIGIKRDYKKALELYIEAANRGDADAQLALGMVFENGGFVDSQNQQRLCFQLQIDRQKALFYYGLAGDQTNALALSKAGKLYFEGGGGIKKNSEIAARLWKSAAKHGDASTKFRFGAICDKGLGREMNYLLAAHYFQIAAKEGHNESKLILQNMIEDGKIEEKERQNESNLDFFSEL